MSVKMAQALQNILLFLAIFGAKLMPIVNAANSTDEPIFVFGDSTADVGTNDNLNECKARADYPYYGIDFEGSKPTGRFSNGLNTADTIVKHLGGYDLSPQPFLTLVKNQTLKQNLLHGINFASGGGGLFRETGQTYYGKVISLEEQIQQFSTVKDNITELIGASKANLRLQNSMYIISIGSNDIVSYLFNRSMTPEQLIANLTIAYSVHLQNLHNLGARKFGIISVPALGCCPVARSINPTGSCVDEANDYAKAFYTSIQSLLKNCSSTMEGFKYSLGDAYNMTMDIINNPGGFKDVTTACCGDTTKNPFVPCKEGSPLCANRSDYLFWDPFHPTEAGSELAAKTLVYIEGSELVTPINFGRLRRA